MSGDDRTPVYAISVAAELAGMGAHGGVATFVGHVRGDDGVAGGRLGDGGGAGRAAG